MKNLRVAIIGCGAVAENYYAPALKKMSEQDLLSVVAVYDVAQARAEKLHKLCQASTILKDLSAMTSMGIDLAIVSSPVGYHAEQSIEALRLGSAVLCEKPMAKTVAQCKSMIEEANAQQSLLAIGHFRRQFPAARAIKEILDSNLLGAVKSFKFNEGGPFQWPAASRALFDKKEAGGGVLMDLGVHMLDLALWWFGDVQELTYEDDAMGGVEANCHLQLKFQTGNTGITRLSRDWWLDNLYTIECEKGTITWQVTQATNIVVSTVDESARKAVDAVIARTCVAEGSGPDHLQAFESQLLAVIGAVNAGELLPVVTGVEAMKSLELVEACYSQAKLISMPWLSASALKRAEELAVREAIGG